MKATKQPIKKTLEHAAKRRQHKARNTSPREGRTATAHKTVELPSDLTPPDIIVAYTDGSSSLKDKQGGWAFVARFGGEEFRRSGFLRGDITSNKAELSAMIECLKSIGLTGQPLRVFTDSQYVANCINAWIPIWQRNDWKTSTGELVSNLDMLKALWRLVEKHRENRAVTIAWVKGHNGNPLNELADRMAGKARKVGKGVNRIRKV